MPWLKELAEQPDTRPWMAQLKDAGEKTIAQSSEPMDPWLAKLACVQGVVHGDGRTRITSSALADLLGIPSKRRDAAMYRRLSACMQHLNWSPIKVRTLGKGKYTDCVRGYIKNVDVLAK